MNKNQIIGLLLIFGILIGYMVITSPSKEELAKQKAEQDSIAQVKHEQDSLNAIAMADSIKAADTIVMDSNQVIPVDNNIAGVGDSLSTDSISAPILFAQHGHFYKNMAGKEESFYIESDLLRIEFNSKGGGIKQVWLKDFLTYDKEPLKLYYEDNNYLSLAFSTNKTIANTKDLFFEPLDSAVLTSDSSATVDSDSLVFTLKAPAYDDKENEVGAVLIHYIIPKNSYLIHFSYEFVGAENFMPIGNTYMDMSWNADLQRQEKSLKTERDVTTIYYRDSDEDVDYLSERKDDSEEITTSLKWVSFKQQFFSTSLIAKDRIASANLKTITRELDDDHYLKTLQADMSIEFDPQSSKGISFDLYMGPNKYRTLRDLDLDLERQIPLGWSFAPLAWINRFAVIPVFNWLESYGFGYGIIILLLTIMLKTVLFPIAFRTYKSSAKMRVLKPEIDEIGKKFPKKEDSMKKQQATMALYKKAGVSPMAGCVPMLLQFPILIAMFRFFPASIELRQQSFLWADDLSSYDSVLDLGTNIPFYGDHVSLFTLLMTISTVIYTRINNQMMASTNQMPGMKTIMYIMPIMFLGFFNNYASGLSYYYLLANLITFAQMFFIRRLIDEDKLRLTIEAHKKKPATKSKFQQRLEEAAKARGQQKR
ncbi:MAG: membrane protein insertase YidC [Bacteroidales bacterium]|nr:membrane protein insertase YidC [Bacteroidales bacterium]